MRSRLALVGLLLLTAGCERGCGEGPRQGSTDGDTRGPVVIECPAEGCPADARPGLEGGRLRVHVEAEPNGLCDLVSHQAWVRWVVENQVMETLVEQDPGTGKISPRLATRWESVGEGQKRTLVFHLREGVTFHDGHPFGAGDVVFTLMMARNPALAADQRSDLMPIESIQTPDDHTVVLRVPRPAPFLLQTLAHLTIYPRHLLENTDLRTSSFCRAPVGTGPFRFGSWQSGSQISIDRAPRYWGTPPMLEGVDFRVVRDRQAAWLLYQRGELDVMWRLPPDVVATAEHDPKLARHRLYRQRLRSFFFVVWNTRRPSLQNAEVREALAGLVDWPRLIEVGFAGRARSHSGPYLAGTPSYDPAIEPWPYQPDRARAALAALPDAPKKLRFLATAGSTSVDQLATLLEEDLRRAGIELVVEKLDFAQVLARLHAHDFDVSALQLSLAIDQDNYGLFHSRASDEQNWAGFADAEVDDVLEQIRATEAPDERHPLERRLHALLHRRGPMSFLLCPEVESAIAPGWAGVVPSADGLALTHAHRIAP